MWLGGGRAIALVLAMVGTLATARFLGPEDFGRLSYSVALVMLAREFANLGIRGVMTTDLVRSPRSEHEILGTAFGLRLVGSVAAAGLALAAALAMRPGDLETVVLVAVLCIGIVSQATRVLDEYYESRVASRFTVVSETSATAAWVLGVLLLTLWGGDTIWFAWAKSLQLVLASSIMAAMFVHLRHGRFSNWRFSRERARLMLRRSWPLALSGVGVAIYLRIDQVMLGQFVGHDAVGLYAAAAQVSEATYFVPLVIASSLFPQLVRWRDEDRDEFNRRVQSLLASLAWLAVAMSLLVTISATNIMVMLFGPTFRGSSVILAVHIWASVFIFMRAVLSKWLIIEERYVFSLVTHGAGAVVNVVGNFVLIPRLGALGAAVATVVSYAMASYLALFLSARTRQFGVLMTKALAWPLLQLRQLIADRDSRYGR